MKTCHLVVVGLTALCTSVSTHAVSNKNWDDISTVTEIGLIGTALATPTLRGDWRGLGQAGLSIGVAGGAATGLKAVIHEERPDNSDNNSFPSGHTTFAFASATTLHRRYGWQWGAPAYVVATFTGVARVAARKHHWWDVLAGAAIGTGSGWFFTSPFDDKVQLVPWVEGKGAGIRVAIPW